MTKRGGWPPTGFGERLRQEREKAGLTQAQLAERAGCNVFTVAKTERGEQEPAWPLVLALARALGVDVTAFVPDSPSPADQPKRKRGRPRKTEGED
jgi:transcriptional regulator with XRE-family HTH domain